jgi:hypothetical protein
VPLLLSRTAAEVCDTGDGWCNCVLSLFLLNVVGAGVVGVGRADSGDRTRAGGELLLSPLSMSVGGI